MAVAGSKERAGHNEGLFREVNENIAKLEEQLNSGSDSLPVICECSRADCAMQIEVGIAEYEAVRRHPHRFIVARGHEQPDLEKVVEEGHAYVIVEKLGAAAEAADEIPA